MKSAASAHTRYREQLEALAEPDVLVLAAEEAAARWDWPEERTWRRMYERFDPGHDPYATSVLVSGRRIVRLEAFRQASPEPSSSACVVLAGAAGGLRISCLDSDAGLPTLARALAGPERAVVRYRPARRCTIRVDGEGATRFLKVYANGAAERAHADGVRLWQAAQLGRLGFAVAEPERFDPSLRAVWQRAIAGGRVLDHLRGPGGEELARRLGRAAGTLPEARLRPPRRRDRAGELARSRLRCAELVCRVPRLGEQVRRLLAALGAAVDACDASHPRPVHGALHVSQWLENEAGVALLDYDSLALGDPELDAATFLADLDVENRDRVPIHRLSSAFLSGYETAAGPLDSRLLGAYLAQRRLEKALRVARAVRPDGDRKAERRLRRAIHGLEGSR